MRGVIGPGGHGEVPSVDLVVVAPPTDDIAAVTAPLSLAGVAIEQVCDPDAIARAVVRGRPKAVLVDLRCDNGVGSSTVAWLNRKSNVATLVITDVHDVEARLHALAEGAADHVVAPFDGRELRARLEHLLHTGDDHGHAVIQCGDVVVDLSERCATRGGEHIRLTPRELDVLRTLIAANGKPVAKRELLRQVWRGDPRTENVVEATVSSLRRKLHAHGAPVVHTIHRAGYLFRAASPPALISRSALLEQRDRIIRERDAAVLRRNEMLRRNTRDSRNGSHGGHEAS